jgi:hypothetical protein
LGGESNFLLGADAAATLSEDDDVDATTVGTTKPVVADGATTATAARKAKLEKDVFIFCFCFCFCFCLCLCFCLRYDLCYDFNIT